MSGKACHEATTQLQHWRAVVSRGRLEARQQESDGADGIDAFFRARPAVIRAMDNLGRRPPNYFFIRWPEPIPAANNPLTGSMILRIPQMRWMI